MSSAQKRLVLKAPNLRMAGSTLWCEVEKRLLQIDRNGLLHDLTDEQAAELLKCGYTLAEGQTLLEMRQKADAYAKAAAAFAAAEDATVGAIRAARADGVSEETLADIIKSAGKAHQTVLPDVAEIAPLPVVEKKPAPAAAAAAPAEPPAAEKKPGGKKSLSESIKAEAKPAAEGEHPRQAQAHREHDVGQCRHHAGGDGAETSSVQLPRLSMPA